MHTVGPRFNTKYRTAAESALFNSYRESLQGMLYVAAYSSYILSECILIFTSEHNLPTLGLPPVNSLRRGYPSDIGTHIALRSNLKRLHQILID